MKINLKGFKKNRKYFNNEFYILKDINEKFYFIQEKDLDKNEISKNEILLKEVKVSETFCIESEKNQKFIEFNDSEESYGGSQKWFEDILNIKLKHYSGCGSIAATNVILYNSFTNRNGIGKRLFKLDKSSLSKEDFIKLANQLYDKIPQYLSYNGKTAMGVWSIKKVLGGIKNFSAQIGLEENFKCMILKNIDNDYLKAYDFIKNNLKKDRPVILFVMLNPYANTLIKENIMSDKHYVTITRVNKHDEDIYTLKDMDDKMDKKYIRTDNFTDFSVVVSNLGDRTLIPSFKQLWNGGTKYMGEVSLAAIDFIL